MPDSQLDTLEAMNTALTGAAGQVLKYWETGNEAGAKYSNAVTGF